MKYLKIIIFFLLLSPLTALALDYDITNYKIEANIQNNGDMHVCESIVQKGSFNGYIRDLEYSSNNSLYNASNIENIEVFKMNPNTFEKQEQFSKVAYANAGEKYKYIVSDIQNGYSIKMFHPGGHSGYLLCYDLKNVAILHNDYGEVYWNFIGNEFLDTLNNVSIKVNLPGIDNNLLVWAHGPLSGNVSRKTNNTNSYLEATISEVSAYQPIDIRMLFNKDLINLSNKKTNKQIYDEVIKEETKKAEEANKKRQISKIIYTVQLILFIIFLPISIVIVIYCYFKYDKEHKVMYNHEYQREFPDNNGPEYVDYLIHKSITDNAYQATILEIIRKRALKVEKDNTKKNNYILKNQEQFVEKLTLEEKMVHMFLLNSVGNGQEFSLEDLKKYPKKQTNAKAWIEHIEKWKKDVKTKATAQNNFEKSGAWKFAIVYLIYAILTFICCKSLSIIIPIIIIVIGIIVFLYLCLIKKRTKEGALLYEQWMALKRFLEDFGRLNEKELPEIVLWERYLVYATVFGIADKVQQAMKIKIDTYHMDTSYDPTFTSYLYYSNFNTVMAKSVARATQESHVTIANSTKSSGSGFGGGFSGGAGFGGGGGGGRGF